MTTTDTFRRRCTRGALAVFALALLVGSPIPVAADPAASFKVENVGGAVTAKVEPKGDGRWEIQDGSSRKLASVELKGERLVVTTAGDRVHWKIKPKDGGAEIEAADGRRLWKVKLDDDGDWKLKDSSGATRLKCRTKPNGAWAVRDPDGRTLAKAKPKDGKVWLESDAGEKMSKIAGTTDARAAMWFAAPILDDTERAALALWFLVVMK